MKNKLLKLSFLISIAFALIFPIVSSAQFNNQQNSTTAPNFRIGTYEQNLYDQSVAQRFNTQSSAGVADICRSLDGIGNVICKIHHILNSIIPVLVALGMLYFVWGIVQYVIGGEEEAKKKGKEKIIYGIIGLAIIIGVWGLVNIVVKTFDLGGTASSISDLVSPIEEANLGPGCDLPATHPKFQDVLSYATCIISNSIIPLMFALAVAMFVWGVVQFVINSSEEAKKEKGRQFMMWGVIALTVMLCVWGLVSILGGTFGVDTNFIPQVSPTRVVP